MLWLIIYKRMKERFENMETKQNFKITLESADNTEIKLWSGKCTGEELNKKFLDAIKAQKDKYRTDTKRCKLRAYDDTGRIIAQETFHGLS